MTNYVLEIEKLAEKYIGGGTAFALAQKVLSEPKFPTWTGSAKIEHHHYGDGGLARHTYEVIKLTFLNKQALHIKDIDPEELFLSGLYHDIGKLWDYDRNYHAKGDEPKWIPTLHKRNIHHISRSAIYWSRAVHPYAAFEDAHHDNVLHAILSHHGQREWGSPVAPSSKIAWLLHLCDGISARMDDCNTNDFIKK